MEPLFSTIVVAVVVVWLQNGVQYYINWNDGGDDDSNCRFYRVKGKIKEHKQQNITS